MIVIKKIAMINKYFCLYFRFIFKLQLLCVLCFVVSIGTAKSQRPERMGATSINNVSEELFLCTVNLGPDTSVCQGDFVVFNAGPGFISYVWQDGSTNQTITASTEGYYSVTVTDNTSCTAQDSVFLTVIPPPIDFSLGNDTVICSGFTVVLDAGAGYDFYMWQDGSTNQTFTASEGGLYSVSVSSLCGIATDSIVITEMPLPYVTLGPDSSVCTGVTVTIDPGGGFTTYLWQDSTTNQTFVATVAGTYMVTVTDGNGCQSHDGINITFQTMPVVNLGADGDLCDVPQIMLDAGSGTGFSQYSWQNGSIYQTYTVTEPGYYSVTVSNSCGGVSDSIYFAPCPECLIEVPNAFSPNGDGVNDILYVYGNGYTRMQLLIYNRHGELMFETKDPATGWDGYFNGVLQPVEVYYYYLNGDCLNDEHFKKKGDVTLLQ
jgi:gliding motility-associated-like protein